MKDSENLRKGVTNWLAYIAPTLAPIEKYEWTGQDIDQYWDFLKRGVIKRQHEALIAICNMAENGVGHFGVTLVRPAFEELIWIEYLDKNKSKANELVVLLTMQEITANLVAQNDYVGVKGMKALGFTQRFVKSSLARNRKYNKQIRDLARELGWPKRREGALPSMAFLARKVGRAKEYGFLYQGTSRYVHFSTTEILRRVWGVKGKVTIGSSTFSSYWEAFSLYWSFRILIELLNHCSELLGDSDAAPEKHDEIMKWVTAFKPIPIITTAELKFWGEPID